MKQEIVDFFQRLYNKNLTTASGGNISIKDNNLVYISPSGIDKAKLTENDIAIYDLSNSMIINEIKPTCELNLHLEIYKTNKDVNAIIHAHPLYSSIFSVLKEKVQLNIVSETVIVLNEVGYVDYLPPSSIELAKEAGKKSQQYNTLIMRNHGVIALGKSLIDCFHKIEVLEMNCKLQYMLKNFPKSELNLLNDIQIDEIKQLFK